MRDASETGKAVGRNADLVAGRDEVIGRPDAAQPSADRRPYSELPDRGKKWPKPVRVLFITGSAAALWGLIFLGLKLL